MSAGGPTVTFYGVRGSTPCDGHQYSRYGGNTSSVALEAPGHVPVIFDLGTGVRAYGDIVTARRVRPHGEPRPFAVRRQRAPHPPPLGPRHRPAVLHPRVPSRRADHGARSAPDRGPARRRVRRGDAAAVLPDHARPARWRRERSSTSATTSSPSTARRCAAAGCATPTPRSGSASSSRVASVTYISDHGPGCVPDDPDDYVPPGVLELCDGVDVLIHDAQHTVDEYEAKRHFGHSSIEYAVHVAREAGAKRLVLFHHCPTHSDDDVDRILDARAGPVGPRRRARRSSPRTRDSVLDLADASRERRGQGRARRDVLRPDQDEFRRALGPVRHRRHDHHRGRPTASPSGVAANSFTSVSLDPPLVLFCVARTSTTWPRIEKARKFAVNILGEHQEELSRLFATKGADRFGQTEWHIGVGGSPVLHDTIAYLDCEFWAEYDGGDHIIVVGPRPRPRHSRTTPARSSSSAASTAASSSASERPPKPVGRGSGGSERQWVRCGVQPRSTVVGTGPTPSAERFASCSTAAKQSARSWVTSRRRRGPRRVPARRDPRRAMTVDVIQVSDCSRRGSPTADPRLAVDLSSTYRAGLVRCDRAR